MVFRFGAGPQFSKFRCGDITPVLVMSVEATDVGYPRYVAHWRRVPNVGRWHTRKCHESRLGNPRTHARSHICTNGPFGSSQSRRIATWSRKWRFTTGVRCAPRPRRRYPKRSWRDVRRRLCAGYTRRSGEGSICRSYRTCTAGGIPITSREFRSMGHVSSLRQFKGQTLLPCDSDIFT